MNEFLKRLSLKYPPNSDYPESKPKLKIGDIIINHWAGDINPTRIGVVIKVDKFVHHIGFDEYGVNRLFNDKNSKTQVIGNLKDYINEPE